MAPGTGGAGALGGWSWWEAGLARAHLLPDWASSALSLLQVSFRRWSSLRNKTRQSTLIGCKALKEFCLNLATSHFQAETLCFRRPLGLSLTCSSSTRWTWRI